MAKGSGQLRQNKRLKRHYVTKTRVTRYGFRNFARNMWLTVAATVVMTITLLLMFVTFVASNMLSGTVNQLREEKMDISIYFKPDTSDDTLRNLAGKLRVLENVKSVEIANNQMVYDDIVDQNKETPLIIEAMGYDEDVAKNLIAIIRVKVYDVGKLDSVKGLVENDKLFQEWLHETRVPSYESEYKGSIDTISKWLNFAQKGGLVIGGVFLVISILVIFNTIRMAIFSRREEIDMMKSIGADRNFIRGPFLVEAEMYGFFAALIAVTLGYSGFMWALPGLERYGIIVEPVRDILVQWWPAMLFGMLALGMLIGYVSARLAVRRYLQP